MRFLIAPVVLISFGVTAANAADLRDRTILVRSIAPAPSGASVQRYGVTREDFRLIKSLLPTAESIIPIRNIPKQRVRVGDRTIETTIRGTTNRYFLKEGMRITRGRFLDEADVVERNNVAVIHSNHAKELFLDDDPIGKAIQFSNEYFTVVGVVETDARTRVLIPYTTMRSRMGDQTISRQAGMFEISQYELSEIEIVVTRETDVEETIKTIEYILQENHSQQDFDVTVNP